MGRKLRTNLTPSRHGWARRFVGIFFLFVLASGLAACASQSGAPKVVKVGIEIEVSESLNPDINERPSPLMLAVYQLKNAESFRNKDFFSVFDPQGIALHDDLLGREQITLQPGVSHSFETEFDAQTAFVGVVGAFSDIENAQWRAIIELPDKGFIQKINIFNEERLQITVGGRSVAIAIGG